MIRAGSEKPIPSPTATGPVVRVAARAIRAGWVSFFPANTQAH